MKLDIKSIDYPSHLGTMFLYGLGILIFFFLMFSPSPLWEFFFWFPLPWFLFWINVNPKYIFFDTVDITDEGIIIRHKKKNWLTSWINNVSIPWGFLSQIRAIFIQNARIGLYRYHLVLLDGTMLRIPVPAEKFAANEVAERFALFLKETYGQNVAACTPPPNSCKSCIMVSQIDDIDGISENIRAAMKPLKINYEGAFVVGLTLVLIMILYQIQNPTEAPSGILLILIIFLFGVSFLPLGHDETKLNQDYLDFLGVVTK